MLIYLLIIFSIYFGFLIACLIGWQRFAHSTRNQVKSMEAFVSVIVAMRDEELSITRLLDSIQRQDYPLTNFEVILVDDHSVDNTLQKISNWRNVNSQIKCNHLSSVGNGKKAALTAGIHTAKGKIILTTDADCVLPIDWITQLVKSFEPDTTMVMGLVKVQPNGSYFSKLQALEFTGLMGSGVALSALGFPVMCNGASLAFRKDSFDAVNGYEGNLHIPSGDDEFLMRKLATNFPGSIHPIKGISGAVTTPPQPTLSGFINQRIRWAGKWKANDSLATKGLALFILIFHLMNILAFILLITGEDKLVVTLLLAIKIILEGYFIYKVSSQLNQPFSPVVFMVLQGTYSVYVVVIGVLSQLLDYEWKGRKEKSIG